MKAGDLVKFAGSEIEGNKLCLIERVSDCGQWFIPYGLYQWCDTNKCEVLNDTKNTG